MLKIIILSLVTCQISSPFVLPSLSGIVQDASGRPIDEAKITVYNETGKGFQTSSSMGSFSLSGIPEGDYLFQVESVGRMLVTGELHLADNGHRKINVVMLDAALPNTDTVGAGGVLREAVRLPRSSSKPPNVKPAQVIKKVAPVYPAAERMSGVRGMVRIAMIILPDGTLDDLVVLSAPNHNLGIAALKAVRLWKYSPTFLDVQPVEASLTIDVKLGR